MADEGVPPLEDMTATLEQAKRLQGLRLGTPDFSIPSSSTAGNKNGGGSSAAPDTKQSPATAVQKPQTQPNTVSAPQSVNSAKSSPPNAKSGSGDFGGMKKGFLFGGSMPSGKQQGKTEAVTNTTDSGKANPSGQTESIPFIQAKTEDKQTGLKLDEVQQAQAMEPPKDFTMDKDWVTDDLLRKLQINKTLRKGFVNDHFMDEMKEFQNKPSEAMARYKSNPEIQQFLKEFCEVLGEHFGNKQDAKQAQDPSNARYAGLKLTDKGRSQASASPPVDGHAQQILADPANREILMDPKIQQLIWYLRSSPEMAQKMLTEGDTDFRQKVDRLIFLGLLKFQS